VPVASSHPLRNLELNEEVVGTRPAIDPKLCDRMGQVAMRGGDEVVCLEGDAFERGSDDVGRLRAAGDAGDRAAGVGVPVGSAKPDEGGDETDPARVLHQSGQLFRLGRRFDKPKLIAQPLDCRPGNEDRPLDGEGRLALRTAGEGGQKSGR